MPWRKPLVTFRKPGLSATACLCGTWSGSIQTGFKRSRRAKGFKKANLAGFISGMDAVLGRLLNSLKDPDRNGDKSDSIANDTLILFTSDNGGTHFDNLPLRGVKGMFTEGGIRIPLIAYWPVLSLKTPPTDRMVQDNFYPTCWNSPETTGFPPAKKHPLDGESFAKFLLNPKSQKAAPIFTFSPVHGCPCTACVVTIDEIDEKV